MKAPFILLLLLYFGSQIHQIAFAQTDSTALVLSKLLTTSLQVRSKYDQLAGLQRQDTSMASSKRLATALVNSQRRLIRTWGKAHSPALSRPYLHTLTTIEQTLALLLTDTLANSAGLLREVYGDLALKSTYAQTASPGLTGSFPTFVSVTATVLNASAPVSGYYVYYQQSFAQLASPAERFNSPCNPSVNGLVPPGRYFFWTTTTQGVMVGTKKIQKIGLQGQPSETFNLPIN